MFQHEPSFMFFVTPFLLHLVISSIMSIVPASKNLYRYSFQPTVKYFVFGCVRSIRPLHAEIGGSMGGGGDNRAMPPKRNDVKYMKFTIKKFFKMSRGVGWVEWLVG